MADAEPEPLEQRVLALLPTAKDAEIACAILQSAGIDCEHCATLADLRRELELGAGALLLAEEALALDHGQVLAKWLADQPPWSDLPILVVARPGADSAAVMQSMDSLGNVTVLERPTRVAALVSAIRTALRARRRQYETRRHLSQLLESEERFRLLAENVTDYAILFMDADGRIATWNEGAERHLGYTAAEVVGERIDRFFTVEDQIKGLPQKELETAVADGRAADENWAVRKDGTWFWASGVTTSLWDDEGRRRGFVKIFRDLSEQRAAEAALRQSRERLQVALAAARMGVWTLDVERNMQRRDANLNALLGLESVETRQPFEEFIRHVHPEDHETVLDAFDRSIELGEKLNVEFRVVWPSGAVHWLRDQGDIFGEGDDRHMAGVCVAVTDIKTVEQELRRAHDELEVRVNERTAELAETVAALESEARAREELQRQLARVQEEERRRIARDLHDSLGQYITAMNLGLKTAAEQATVQQTTVDQLAELAKLAREMGKEAHRLATELRPRALDDIGLAAAVQQTLEAWTERTRIPVEFAAPGLGESTFSTQVSTTVYRVIQETLNNVAKHAGATRVSIVLERTNQQLILVVEDNGKGFAIDEELNRKREAGGLGLPGMQERAVLAGGVLEIESSPGQGTSVFLRIPLASGEQQ